VLAFGERLHASPVAAVAALAARGVALAGIARLARPA
jgi:hypothetical protein